MLLCSREVKAGYVQAHRVRLLQLLKTPVMAATALGVAMKRSVTTLPRTLYAAIKMEGDASIPMLLFALDLMGSSP